MAHTEEGVTCYFNRELSWLEFNDRVLRQAQNPDNPLLERFKFLSIVSSNLDEFFMIRVASLMDQHHAGYQDPAGLNPKQQLKRIAERTHILVAEQYETLADLLRGADQYGFSSMDALSQEAVDYLKEYYIKEIFPVLTPLAVDASRPFPLLSGRSVNLGVFLDRGGDAPAFVSVQLPAMLRRVIELPDGRRVMLEQVMTRFMGELLEGETILFCHPFRITRNADLNFEDEDVADLLSHIKKTLKKRKWGEVIRLEVDAAMPDDMRKWLMDEMDVAKPAVYQIDGPLGLDFLIKELYGEEGQDELRYPPQPPNAVPFAPEEIFSAISQRDILLHHPYDPFDPVVWFVQQAARDPQVLAIKQTLYRVSGNSPIVKALSDAAEAGKQVTVLLEVKARFDEENNIHWGTRLEQAGCHVIYGLVHLKTHSKITLVVRREENGIQRYVHLGTGNYNDVTARFYTDMGLFSVSPEIGQDASAFFNMITGYSQMPIMHKLVAAPRSLRDWFIEAIRREARNASNGREASIFAKMNSLVDNDIISALYDAAGAGVKIRLLIRGICCLNNHCEKAAGNIDVHSIVGRYLEHSRIFIFHESGQRSVYLSSADWMPRNLDRRVELLFPVDDPDNASRVREIMELYWQDNMNSSLLLADGSYRILSGDGFNRVQTMNLGTMHASARLPY